LHLYRGDSEILSNKGLTKQLSSNVHLLRDMLLKGTRTNDIE
jgi:hypothetical protein